MSNVDVTIPQDLWDDESEGSISTWFFNHGDHVEEGDLLAEVMNEKVSNDLYATATGKLSILVEPETAVEKGQVVARIEG